MQASPLVIKDCLSNAGIIRAGFTTRSPFPPPDHMTNVRAVPCHFADVINERICDGQILH